MHRWAAALLLISLAACRYDENGDLPECRITLSGAINGSWDCRPATLTWNPSIGNAAALVFDVAAAPDRPQIDASVGWAREPTAGQYLSSDADAQGFVLVTLPDGTQYDMQVGPPFNLGPGDNSWNLVLDSCDGPIRRYTGYAFNATGTLDATLGGGALLMHVTF